MDNKDKIIESAEELKRGLELLSRERKVVMPHNKACLLYTSDAADD